MTTRNQQLHSKLAQALAGSAADSGTSEREGSRANGHADANLVIQSNEYDHMTDEVTLEVSSASLIAVCSRLKSHSELDFSMLVDLCGVDYATYGESEWSTDSPGAQGFSRAVDANSVGRLTFGADVSLPKRDRPRFAVVYHLLSLTHNTRLRVRVYAEDDNLPVVPSVTDIWSCADWYEREAFDLYGILFEGHNDLRRLLTDYGFVGHPFRKDFPLVGNVEMRYDPDKGRVVYEPVSIEPRVLVPRVIRDDNRYASGAEPEPEVDEAAATDSDTKKNGVENGAKKSA